MITFIRSKENSKFEM